MQIKTRWMDAMVAEAANTALKMPFERGERRAELRARCGERIATEKRIAAAV